uniref:Battenin n=1 Tax=Panagrolaimus sp. ES5 TaxID=591445 RepID=A0AC34GUL1_9BILA
MLSGAKDIIDMQNHNKVKNNSDVCFEKITRAHCSKISASAVLLADTIPCVIVELTFPFFMNRIPYGVRHAIVVSCQALSFIIVAFSPNVIVALIGVVFAAIGAGLGAINCLALSSHFSKTTVSTWSSGTGAAGVVASFAYAAFTEPHLANLSPKVTMLIMLVIPLTYSMAYWAVLNKPNTIYKCNLLNPLTWIVPYSHDDDIFENSVKNLHVVANYDEEEGDVSEIVKANQSGRVVQRKLSLIEKFIVIKSLWRYMIPVILVYFAQYFINQGLTPLIYFDCSHGFNLSKASQYRWFQVLYQTGTFISRSSVNIIQISMGALYLMPVLQAFNAIFLTINAIYFFVPHISLIFGIILIEGIIGGLSYVNSLHRMHRNILPDVREFAMSTAGASRTLGIVMSGFIAIPVRNYICNRQHSSLNGDFEN